MKKAEKQLNTEQCLIVLYMYDSCQLFFCQFVNDCKKLTRFRSIRIVSRELAFCRILFNRN